MSGKGTGRSLADVTEPLDSIPSIRGYVDIIRDSIREGRLSHQEVRNEVGIARLYLSLLKEENRFGRRAPLPAPPEVSENGAASKPAKSRMA